MWFLIDCRFGRGSRTISSMLFRDFCSPCFWLVLTLFIAGVRSEEECLYSKIWCYECESWNDPRCKDPFNNTGNPENEPTLKLCEGCCVKIVSQYMTPNETVRRTCTQNLQINLFLVDHVCMYESRNTGHMCFCETERCNAAVSDHRGTWLRLLASTSILFFLTRRHGGLFLA